MALKTYVGARYAPKFMGAWNKSNEYAALSVVYSDNQSYVSRKTVPAETEITNTEYWIRSSDWNAQMDQYRNQVDAYDEKVVQYNQNVEAYNTSVNNFFEETIHAYNTKEGMVKDQSIKEGYTLITCGESAIGDGSGAFYQAVTETSSGAVALENGLFAKKFQLMPERFNRYSVNNWDEAKNLTLAPGDIVTNLNSAHRNTISVYMPESGSKTVTLFGMINSASYYGEFKTLKTELGNNYHYFYIAGNNNTYLAFKIINFTINYESLNEQGYPGPIYLLPNDICTNELPCGKSPDMRLYIGDIDGSVYTIKMAGTPNTKTILNISSKSKNEIVSFDSYPSDYFVNITYNNITGNFNATTVNPKPQTAGDVLITGNGSGSITISKLNGAICTTPINIAASTSTLNITLGECGSNLSVIAEIYYTNIVVLIPFNNTTSNTKQINVNATYYTPNGGEVVISELSVPAGRSLYAVALTQKGPNNLAFNRLL